MAFSYIPMEKQEAYFLISSTSSRYGYSSAHLRYAALQGGVNFVALEGKNIYNTFWSYRNLWTTLFALQRICKTASKSILNKWSFHSPPMAVNSVTVVSILIRCLSYGFLKRKITNALISTTTKLKNAKMLTISTTVSKQFATGIQGVTFEPQAQLAYQHLMFDTIKDADNLTIKMQNPSQWIIPCWWTFDKNHCH
ncbi:MULTISPECIES: autotransporter outer membrane beta-barrel domain-containing protein [unclassified Bartonella]|uniref:autotransporter outer membrane beta-barrel domain-containing protein n=1 Tax=unclassified Bartonella TaxID=2645622 RepID=UPI0035D00A31